MNLTTMIFEARPVDNPPLTKTTSPQTPVTVAVVPLNRRPQVEYAGGLKGSTESAGATSARLLTTAQAAEHLGLSADRLKQLRRRGCGPDWGKLQSTIRYDVDDLNRWRK